MGEITRDEIFNLARDIKAHLSPDARSIPNDAEYHPLGDGRPPVKTVLRRMLDVLERLDG